MMYLIRMKTSYFFLLLFVVSGTWAFAQKDAMTNKRLGKILRQQTDDLEGISGNWQVYVGERVLFVITDAAANRMRIFTPIVETNEVDETTLRAMLIANFHTALDAKYSIYEELVISAFTHPLAELTEAQVIDALAQVSRLADTFGTTFSSTGFIFGDRPVAPPPPPVTPTKRRDLKRS